MTSPHDGVDLLNDILADLIERHKEKLNELSDRDELNIYICKSIRLRSLNRFKRKRTEEFIDELDHNDEDINPREYQWQMIESASRSLTYGDRAIIQWVSQGIGGIRSLAEETGEDYEYLKNKYIRAKEKLRKEIWHLTR